jgi:D-cysteine desulfhydrase
VDAAALAHKIRATLAPRCLGAWPTPLEPAPDLARAAQLDALWLKREDRAGGNKVRGLEFLLAGVPRETVFVTVGGVGSSHCLATARHARALGYRVALAQFPQPETDASRAVAAATASAADAVARAVSHAGLPLALARAWLAARRLGTPRWIPGGGAHPRAVVGHLLAALELQHQLAGGPPPDAIVLPLGTGGTAAGIALGMAWLGWPTRVIAVRVAPWLVANRWRVRRLARGAAQLLQRHDIRIPHLASHIPEVVDGLGAGYGHPTEAGERARALAADHGLQLDPTYGAKAFAFVQRATLTDAAGHMKRVIFWNTFSWP